MEIVATPGDFVCTVAHSPGPAGACSSLLAAEQQECSTGQGWPPHGGFLPPVL